MHGPCEPWVDAAALDSCGGADLDPLVVERIIGAASEALYRLSGSRFSGLCVSTTRPCARRVGAGTPPGWVPAWGWWGTEGWSTGPSPGAPTAGPAVCGCNGGPVAIDLGPQPVVDVLEVLVDGLVLDEERYRVDDRRWLIRLPDADGTRPGWPATQDWLAPTTEEGTWQVTWTHGEPVPDSGVHAAAALACEMVKAAAGQECALDRRVTTLARQGVTISLPGLVDSIGSGRTGLPDVDLFLAWANPHRLSEAARVISPDVPRRRRGTSDPGGS